MNKRLLTLFIGLAVIVVLVILNSVVFVVKSIEVQFETPQHIDSIDELTSSIVTASGITEGKNIFTISESKAKRNIEALPQIEFLDIERYPNRVIIYVARRVPVLAIPVAEGVHTRYVVVDSMMKVISILQNPDAAELSKYTVLENAPLTNESGKLPTVGSTMSTTYGNVITQLQNVAVALQYAGLSPEGIAAWIHSVYLTANTMTLLTVDGVSVDVALKEHGEVLDTDALNARVQKAYDWWLESGENYSSGYAVFDAVQDKYTWYSAQPND